MSLPEVVIVAAARTPIGSFLGTLAPLSAPALGAAAIRAAVERARLDGGLVDQVLMGNVLQAGEGQAPARQAGIYAGLPASTGAITINKVCGSGLRAVMDAANGLRTGEWRVAVAGGMESMSNAPHLLERSRAGYRLGEVKLADAMLKDGLWDPYENRAMGECAEDCVRKYRFSRAEQDAFALASYKRAQAAIERGAFADELVPLEVPQKRGPALAVSRDEEPFNAPLEKMASLKPAFLADGTITAANASKINDGAAALVLTTRARAAELGRKPIARLVSQASFAQEPGWFTTAPAGAVRLALERAGLAPRDIDRWEVNEAFAAVAMAFIRELELDATAVNTRGGAVALGHPIGASGARILTTLLYTLVQEDQRYGCAALCIGGGEAVSVVIENLRGGM
jgi:acetyl-CoA C-acetyltransferase